VKDGGEMRLTILYDNDSIGREGLLTDWGFSCLIEGKETILFDTGADGKILLHNMNLLGVDVKSIDKVVISHEHFDHNGGLEELAKYIGEIELYRIGNILPSEDFELRKIGRDIIEIGDGIWSTGKMRGFLIEEHSLILEGKEGLIVLTGCSHPGVDRILRRAGEIGDVAGIIGGFHDFRNVEVFEGLDLICPCHCTSLKKKILERFPDRSRRCGVGMVIEV
jgi:7,8-dihydropterin-6-yl-methyl-4-(beta-D-ribofuranosyl)aminobenzene 5'-phosphate synthase